MKNSVRSSRVGGKCWKVVYSSVQPSVHLLNNWRVLLSTLGSTLPLPAPALLLTLLQCIPFWFRQLIGKLTSRELHLKPGPENRAADLGCFPKIQNLNFLASEPVVSFKWHVVNLSADVSGPVYFEQNNNNVHICSPFHLVIFKPQVHIN